MNFFLTTKKYWSLSTKLWMINDWNSLHICLHHLNFVIISIMLRELELSRIPKRNLLQQHVIVYYVPRRIMRVITRRATMLAEDRSQGGAETKPRRSRGAISLASILNESRNYSNYVHWHIFYFMWLRCVYEFLCVYSNPFWKGWNWRDYRPSHLTFREYFRPFWFSRSCVEAAYCNRRMRSSNVQGFVSTVPTLCEEE